MERNEEQHQEMDKYNNEKIHKKKDKRLEKQTISEYK